MELEDEDGIAAERIKELEKQRAKELEARRWMASCPDRHNSFGRQELFEKRKLVSSVSKVSAILYRQKALTPTLPPPL